VRVAGETVFTVASVYAVWERTAQGLLFADGSAHRVLSDLSMLMSSRHHRLLVAGDWNVLLGYGEHGDSWFKDRYATVFARADALGLQSLARGFRTAGRRSRGPRNCPPTAIASRRITTVVRTQRPPLASSTSSSPPAHSPTRSASVPSTGWMNGARAIIVEC
jgi:hypothetical protein